MSSSSVEARRTIVYIDGLNLYYGLVAQGWRKYLWLHLLAYAQSLLHTGQRLQRVDYFTTEVINPADKAARQRSYLAALRTLKGVFVTKGRYDPSDFRCPACGVLLACPTCLAGGATSTEKMTDVHIATRLVADAHRNWYDDAILVTGDSDQVPAVKHVRALFPEKRVLACFPPSRKSYHLESVASSVVEAMEENYRKAQFDTVVETSPGRTVTRPSKWTGS